MKKSLLLLLVAMSVCLGGFAQKGRQAVGVDVPLRLNGNASLCIGVKYQYNISNFVCLEPILQGLGDMITEDGDITCIAMLNSKFFFFAPNRFRPYGLIGLGFCVGKYEEYGDSGDYVGREDYEGPIAQIGIGMDYRLNYDWSWQLETGYQFILDGEMNGPFISTGITYNF